MHLCYNGRRFSDLGYECLVYLVCSNKASSHEKKRRLKMTNQSIVAGRRSIKAVLSTVIAILLIVATFTSTAFAQTTIVFKLLTAQRKSQLPQMRRNLSKFSMMPESHLLPTM